MQHVAATSSFVHSTKEALFAIRYPLMVKNCSELPCQKVLMDLKKLHCSPPVFQCNKDQMHLPDFRSYCIVFGNCAMLFRHPGTFI